MRHLDEAWTCSSVRTEGSVPGGGVEGGGGGITEVTAAVTAHLWESHSVSPPPGTGPNDPRSDE